jgi:putative transposase
MEYCRAFSPGGTFFFTVVTYQRQPILTSTKAIYFLKLAFQQTMQIMPFTIVASVVLPDHMHFIWTLPSESSDYSTRWRLIKNHFTKNWCPKKIKSESPSRRSKGEKDVWQRRFWEHLIQDEFDLNNHINYIHFNPVKHGIVNSPFDWKFSSIHKYINDGVFPLDWESNQQLFENTKWME